jgi:hypothetical protein
MHRTIARASAIGLGALLIAKLLVPGAAVAQTASPSLDQLSAALDVLDQANLHDLADDLEAGTVPDGALDRVLGAKMALDMNSWPAELQSDATRLSVFLGRLGDALQANDMATAMQAADTVHDQYHDFSDMAREWLAGQGVPTQANPEMDDHNHDMPGMGG